MNVDLRTVMVDKPAVDWSKLEREDPQQFEYIVAATTDLAYRQRRTEIFNQWETHNDVDNLAVITDEQFRTWGQYFSYEDWYRTFKFDQPDYANDVDEDWFDGRDDEWPDLYAPETHADRRADDCEEFARDEMRESNRRHERHLLLSWYAEKRHLNEIARASGYYPLDETGRVYGNDDGQTCEARKLADKRRRAVHAEKIDPSSRRHHYYAIEPVRASIDEQLKDTSPVSGLSKPRYNKILRKLRRHLYSVYEYYWYSGDASNGRGIRSIERLQHQIFRVEEKMKLAKVNRQPRIFTNYVVLGSANTIKVVADPNDYLLGCDPDEDFAAIDRINEADDDDDYMYDDLPDIDPLGDPLDDEVDHECSHYDYLDDLYPDFFAEDRAM